MAGFVDGDGAFFLIGHDARLLFQTADDTIHRIEEILLCHRLTVVACGDEGGLVADVGDVGAREARRLSGEQVDVQAGLQLEGTQMHVEDRNAFGQIGEIDVDLTVETSGAQQSLVEHVDTVGRGENDDTGVRAETVHFRQQLVEGIFAFVVAAETCSLGAGATHGVNFVDKHDRGRFLLGFFEQVANAASSHADKHFDEVRA